MEIKAVDLKSKQVDWDDLVDGMKVTTLGRMFPFCSLFDHGGELLLQYPYFGCGELLRSSCHVHPVFSLLFLFDVLLFGAVFY